MATNQSPIVETITPAEIAAQLAEARAENESLRWQRDTMYRIAVSRSLKPGEARTYAGLIYTAWTRGVPFDAGFAIDDMPEHKLAEAFGQSVPVVRDNLAKFESAGLVKADRQKPEAVNRLGAPIPAYAMNPERGDRWQREPTIYTVKPVPDVLPKLNPSDRQAKDAAKQRDARAILAALECPHCHAKGNWHAVCGECGCVVETTEADQAGLEGKSLSDNASEGKSLSGKESTEAKSGDRVITTATPNGWNESTDSAISATANPAEIAPDVDGKSLTVNESPAREVLTGAETIDYLAGLGAAFCMVYKPGAEMENHQPSDGKVPIRPRNEWGDPLPWDESPVTAEAVLLHHQRGGNGGHLCGYGNLVEMDVDEHLAEFLTRYPWYTPAPYIFRDNATDKAKIVVYCEDIENLPTSHSPKGAAHRMDLLSHGGQGVCIGTHYTGATIKLMTGKPLAFKAAQLLRDYNEWTAVPPAPDADRTITPPSDYSTETRTDGTAKALVVLPYTDQVKQAIAWWNKSHANDDELDGGLAYVSVRPDDSHPSTHRKKEPDGAYAGLTPAWIDYGATDAAGKRAVYDRFEMHVWKHKLDKSRFIFEVVNEWRAAQGLPALKSR